MGPFDNPSADKFEPPPGSRDPSPEPTGPRAMRFAVHAGVVVLLLRIALDLYRGRHGTSAGVGAIAVALLVLEYVVRARRRTRSTHDTPYRPNQHVTR